MNSTRLQRVLAATNGSEAGQHAAQFARHLAQEIGAKLRLLSVETTGIPGYSSDGPEEAHRTLDDVTWSRGVPGIEIIRAAEAWGADLVVIGRRERCNGDGTLGRTVDAVIRRRSGPSLLLPPRLDHLGRMLIALDGTSRGLGVLAFSEVFAQALGLHASIVFAETDSIDPAPVRSRLRVALLEHPALGGPDQLDVCHGSPVEEILAAASGAAADLLVVGVRRGGPPGDAGSGHVGRDLLLKAPQAILTVPI